jgi:heme exporter protein D
LAADGGASGLGAATGAKALADAHARLVADPAIQFSFSPLPKPPDIVLPEWLKWLGQWIGAVAKFIGHYAIYVFWFGVAVAALAVVFLIVRELMGTRFPRLRRRRPARAAVADWAAGRFDEAAHLILLRGVEEIEDRRPRLVKPALTARDIAALGEVPATARGAFAAITQVVERSLFGGRSLDADAYAQCRAAYEAFAFPRAWA